VLAYEKRQTDRQCSDERDAEDAALRDQAAAQNRGLNEGREKKYGTPETLRKRSADMQHYRDGLYQQKRNMSASALDIATSKKFGVQPRAVRRYTTDPRTRRKGSRS